MSDEDFKRLNEPSEVVELVASLGDVGLAESAVRRLEEMFDARPLRDALTSATRERDELREAVNANARERDEALRERRAVEDQLVDARVAVRSEVARCERLSATLRTLDIDPLKVQAAGDKQPGDRAEVYRAHGLTARDRLTDEIRGGFDYITRRYGSPEAAEPELEPTRAPTEGDAAQPARYPHEDGDVTVLGPECFTDGRVICWKGENYYVRQDDLGPSEVAHLQVLDLPPWDSDAFALVLSNVGEAPRDEIGATTRAFAQFARECGARSGLALSVPVVVD